MSARHRVKGTRRRLLGHLVAASAALPFASLGKESRMRRVFITGSTDGLGRGAARVSRNVGSPVPSVRGGVQLRSRVGAYRVPTLRREEHS